jgi:ABC-2 type transport system permease protein
MISAILRAQILSMRLRAGAGRGSAIFSAATGLFFYGFWALLAWGAMLFFSLPDQAPFFLPVLSSGLMFVMLYWQLAPVISASFGASLDLRKLLVYPIPHRSLFHVEILLRITTCAEMLIAVTGCAIGLLRNPVYGWPAAPYIVAGAVVFTAMNILLSAGTRNWLERLFLRSSSSSCM